MTGGESRPAQAGTDLVVVEMNRARLALAEANIQQTKQIVDMARAMEVYARHQQLGEEAEALARSIHIEALRRLGEHLMAAPKAEGGRPPVKTTSISEGVSDAPPTLAELGIDYKTSAVSQKLATLAKDSPVAFEQVRQGVLTVTRAVAAVVRERNAELKKNAPPLPLGRFETIVIDPPWEMQKIERDVRPNQVAFDYPTMDEDELEVFDVERLAADDCHLFCWTTHKHLPVALRLVEAWGFRYVCTMVWHKAGGFQPIGLPQYNCEFVLYARRGTPVFVDTRQFFCCFDAPRREHSRKPDVFYELVRRVTAGPRIDVFSREKRDGFEQFGNETERFAA